GPGPGCGRGGDRAGVRFSPPPARGRSRRGGGGRGAEELVRRRVWHDVGERFDFTHDRIREVAYAGLLAPRCKFLHRRVAEGIEAVYAGNLEPHALALGRHYRESEAWERAAACLRQAGTAAAQRSALREAVVCFQQAAEALA